jgi:hypothetical protein
MIFARGLKFMNTSEETASRRKAVGNFWMKTDPDEAMKGELRGNFFWADEVQQKSSSEVTK